MMNVLGIVGSPRKDGNTAYLLERTLSFLPDSFQIETVFLKDYRIGPCEACHRCEEDERCVLDDDMPRLYPKLQAADVMILTSPVYMGGVTSRMRAFMERTWHLRKGQLAGKIGTYIVVGRRKPGAAIYAMEDYLARLRLTRLPGICGHAFHKGQIVADKEAVQEIERLAGDILGLGTGGARPQSTNGSGR